LFQYDQGGHLLEEADSQGNSQVDYIYLDGRPVATFQPSDGKFYFLHDNHLGTPQMATDSAQAVAWATTYQPFGQIGTPPTLMVQDLRLPGQENDLETGFYHNGFRDYAPGGGRYVQSDPIGLGGGMNRYGYVGQNPVTNIDPRGLVRRQFLAPGSSDPLVDKLNCWLDHRLPYCAYGPAQDYNDNNYFTFAGHHWWDTPNYIYSTTDFGTAEKFDAAQVAEAILASDWDGQQPLLALVCYGAYGGTNSFIYQVAQDLADLIGAPVTITGSPGSLHLELGHLNPDGGWQTFTAYPPSFSHFNIMGTPMIGVPLGPLPRIRQ
jgi:RHS repeat-associated protein